MTSVSHLTSHPSTMAGSSCTVQRNNGKFCDAPSWPDAPFPICRNHAIELYKEMRGIHRDSMVESAGFAPALDSGQSSYTTTSQKVKRAEAAVRDASSVVYYVRIGDVIKIGYTNNLLARMTQIRIPRESVLATEPGGRALEARRHAQFGTLRKGLREDFEPAFELIQHIDAVRERHGRPVFKTTRRIMIDNDV